MVRSRKAPSERSGKYVDAFSPLMQGLKRLESLHAELDEIPNPPTCLGCGSQTGKALVDYEYDYRCTSDTRITVAKALPGYRCGNCQAESRHPRLSDAFLRALAAGLAAAGDARLQESLQAARKDPRAVGVLTDYRRTL